MFSVYSNSYHQSQYLKASNLGNVNSLGPLLFTKQLLACYSLTVVSDLTEIIYFIAFFEHHLPAATATAAATTISVPAPAPAPAPALIPSPAPALIPSPAPAHVAAEIALAVLIPTTNFHWVEGVMVRVL